MLRNHLYRRGQIPTAVHPFEKAAMAKRIQPQKEALYVYRFALIIYHKLINLFSRRNQ